MRSSVLFWTTLMVCYSSVVSYKILVVGPFPGRSHHILNKAVADTLHDKGHQVTYITCFPSSKPEYREVAVPELMELKDRFFLGFDMDKASKLERITQMAEMMTTMANRTLTNPAVKKLMNDPKETFDLIIIEYFMNEVYFALGAKYDCPIVVLSPVSMIHWLARATGNPTSPATIPNVFLSYTADMSLMQRVVNTAIGVFQEVIGWAVLDNHHESMYRQFFPEEAAKYSFAEVKKRVSLVLINNHYALGVPRPLLPNAVEIGGYHIGEVQPLPEEYQKILDNAKDGVIFFSMGSNLKSAEMPAKVRDDILKSLGKLKMLVLWKFEEDLPGKPDNVIIKKWMPQSSILAHPNVKLFISHGGLLSTTEAASAGVPVLSIPIFGDQHHNAELTQQRGCGLTLEFSNITEASLSWAIDEVLTNPKYEKTAKKIHDLFNDRPIHPRELLAFSVEHVIRTGGAKHLSAPDIGLFSSLLLDVMLILAVPPLSVLIVAVYLGRKCLRKVCKKKAEKEKKL